MHGSTWKHCHIHWKVQCIASIAQASLPIGPAAPWPKGLMAVAMNNIFIAQFVPLSPGLWQWTPRASKITSMNGYDDHVEAMTFGAPIWKRWISLLSVMWGMVGTGWKHSLATKDLAIPMFENSFCRNHVSMKSIGRTAWQTSSINEVAKHRPATTQGDVSSRNASFTLGGQPG